MNAVPDAPTAVAWYDEPVIRRALISVVAQIIAATPLSKYVAGDQVGQYVDLALQGVAIASALWAVHARATTPTPPTVVATKARAEFLNADRIRTLRSFKP